MVWGRAVYLLGSYWPFWWQLNRERLLQSFFAVESPHHRCRRPHHFRLYVYRCFHRLLPPYYFPPPFQWFSHHLHRHQMLLCYFDSPSIHKFNSFKLVCILKAYKIFQITLFTPFPLWFALLWSIFGESNDNVLLVIFGGFNLSELVFSALIDWERFPGFSVLADVFNTFWLNSCRRNKP